MVTETKNAREELENAKQEAEEQAEVAANKAAEAKSVKDEAEATTGQMQQTYDSLSAEAQELMRKEEETAEKARQEAAAREAAAAAAASKNNGGGTVDNSAASNRNRKHGSCRAYAHLANLMYGVQLARTPSTALAWLDTASPAKWATIGVLPTLWQAGSVSPILSLVTSA